MELKVLRKLGGCFSIDDLDAREAEALIICETTFQKLKDEKSKREQKKVNHGSRRPSQFRR